MLGGGWFARRNMFDPRGLVFRFLVDNRQVWYFSILDLDAVCAWLSGHHYFNMSCANAQGEVVDRVDLGVQAAGVGDGCADVVAPVDCHQRAALIHWVAVVLGVQEVPDTAIGLETCTPP